ncbi:MAG: LacI family DNA-binding transcriptional regulator [Lachnospiraceae bacterium]|nr:LacI family DNA-binding transcriptional regulator [Lachnospiraceae bacterium]
MRVTIKDIAERAGVHRATVDKVIHERPGVSDDVRTRIKEIIQELGYTPNPAGRLLQKQGRIYQISAILLDVDAFPYLKQGLEEGIRNQTGFDIRMQVSVCKVSEPERQVELIHAAIEEKVDAIIICPINTTSVREAIVKARENNILVVMTNSYLKNTEHCRCVTIDSVRASKIAARLMGEFLRGKGQVAIISTAMAEENNLADVSVRATGFIDYMKEIYPEIEIAEKIESFEEKATIRIKTQELLERYPNLRGIYIAGGGVAQVGKILKDSGRYEDIKVVCFEDYPEILELLKEGVVDCTLSGDINRQGSLPIELAMDYLVFGKLPKKHHIFTETRVILKESIF